MRYRSLAVFACICVASMSLAGIRVVGPKRILVTQVLSQPFGAGLVSMEKALEEVGYVPSSTCVAIARVLDPARNINRRVLIISDAPCPKSFVSPPPIMLAIGNAVRNDQKRLYLANADGTPNRSKEVGLIRDIEKEDFGPQPPLITRLCWGRGGPPKHSSVGWDLKQDYKDLCYLDIDTTTGAIRNIQMKSAQSQPQNPSSVSGHARKQEVDH